MLEDEALPVFAALSQEMRLRIVRMLVTAGPNGMAAGAIAAAVDAGASNLSFHLKELQRAGLVTARRASRSILYAADYATLSSLIQFLMQDCCAGHPEICGPAISKAGCRPPAAKARAKVAS